ncbi:N-acetyltransferase [Phycicoccus sp. 3266]|uniref:GNAT family N-acetyltransferase n=1 Tax=Phycicoccus sp. 3266 TaxID=2817751 RepID=UPI00285E4203|nr:N-acetyltransferase [Phycicoccus sp. 3266]MDR6863814.1 putative acetyltransferase [Phycicoccus sp. 3266]
MLVRRETTADHDVVHALHRDAFAHGPTEDGRPASDGSLEARLVDELRADGDLLNAMTFVAERDGVVVGHVAMSAATVDGRAGELVALGPLGVLPEHQGAGVGSALVHAALGAADALDVRGVVLLGHPEYYPRFGFGPAVEHGITPPHDWGPRFFLLRRLTAWGDGVHGAFRYADPFERVD